ncbi:hypothetical protein PInf_002639 [Phytophthora infestans]|nr:hypothetical protein PInf_002639 [Phytophthora infestans]
MVVFERAFIFKIRVLHTDFGDEYASVGLFYERTHATERGAWYFGVDDPLASLGGGVNAQHGIAVGIGKETKRHHVHLTKDKLLVTTHHIKNTDTLGKTSVHRLYLSDEEVATEEELTKSVTLTQRKRANLILSILETANAENVECPNEAQGPYISTDAEQTGAQQQTMDSQARTDTSQTNALSTAMSSASVRDLPRRPHVMDDEIRA